jgi:hypothetical protein
MKITVDRLFRFAGFSAVLGGILYVLVGIFHPANTPGSVTTTQWELVHVAACGVSFFGLIGLAGVYVRQALKAGLLGLIGYVLLSLWLALVMGFSFVEAFVLPRLAAGTPAFVTAWMGMFNGPAGTFDLGVLPTVWTATAPLLILGGLLFGVATIRARVLPRLAGALLALSTVLAPVAVLLPNAAQPKTAIPMGIALAWLGFSLWTERRVPLLAVAPRELAPNL